MGFVIGGDTAKKKKNLYFTPELIKSKMGFANCFNLLKSMIANNKWLAIICLVLSVLTALAYCNLVNNLCQLFVMAKFDINNLSMGLRQKVDGFSFNIFSFVLFEGGKNDFFFILVEILLFGLLIKGPISVITYYLNSYCSKMFQKELKRELINTFFEAKFEISSLTARDVHNYISTDVEIIADILWNFPFRFVQNIVCLIQIITYLLFHNGRLKAEYPTILLVLAVAFFLFILLALFFYFFFNKVNKLNSEARKGVIADNKRIFESVDNVEYIKMLSGEEEEAKKVKEILDLSFKRNEKATFANSFFYAITSWVFASNIPQIAIFGVALFHLKANSSFVFGIYQAKDFYNNIKTLNSEVSKLLDTLVDSDDLFSSLTNVSTGLEGLVLSQQKERQNLLAKEMFTSGDIIFKDVVFRYPRTSVDILRNISFVFERGRKYGISGRNGAGKSTIVKTLMKLYNIDGGEIMIGKENINNINTKSFHKQVCYQTHRPVLFSDSIARNIYYPNACPKDYEERLWKIAKKIGVDEFISKLPEGFNTQIKVGSGGSVSFSEGQKQQILAFKIFIHDYDIYIFDEILNNINPELKEIILTNIFSFMKKTAIVIAIDHDYSIFKHMDEIYKFNGDSLERVTLEKEQKTPSPSKKN